MNYVIHLTPKNKNFKPHVWKEGGDFKTSESAEFQAKQIRKTKDYDKVVVVPKDLTKFPKQYGYMSSAERAIDNIEKKHGKQKFAIEQIDEGCFEVKIYF